MTTTGRESLDQLWARFLAGDTLDAAEERALVTALERDPAAREARLGEAELHGLLRALLDEGAGERFVSEWQERWKHEQGKEPFVAAVETKLRAETRPNVPRRGRLSFFGVGLVIGAAAAMLVLVLRPRHADAPRPEQGTAGHAPGAPATTAPGDPPVADTAHGEREVARIEAVRGSGHRVSGGMVRPAAVGDRLASGDGLLAAADSSAIALGLPDGGRLRLRPDTVVGSLAENARSGTTSVFLASGTLEGDVTAAANARPFVIVTRHAQISVRGAAFTIEARARTTRAMVARGQVRVVADRQSATVEAGRQALVGDEGAVAVTRSSSRIASLLVGDARGEAADADQAIVRRLVALGFEVKTKAIATTSMAEVQDSAIVLVSASIRTDPGGTPPLVTRLRDLPRPLVTWEPRLFASLGMTLPGGQEQGVAPATVEILIKDPWHPLSAGLSGTVELVTDTSDGLRWAAPGPFAAWAATLPGEPTKAICFGYDTGVPMPGGQAPARRVGLGMKVTSPLHLSEAGWAVFEAAVRWAANGDATP